MAGSLTRAQKFSAMYGDAGGYMMGLSHASRVKIKKLAAKRGLTISGLLQTGVPEPLRERSTDSLRQQALDTISKAYGPAESALDSREQQIRNLDVKRQMDNQFYRNWLADQQNKADAVAQASDAALIQAAGAMHDAVGQRYDQAQQALNQANAATPGNV